MKKYFKFMIAMAFLVVVLAACGDDNNGGAATTTDTDADTEVVLPPTDDTDTDGETDIDTVDVNVFLISHSPTSILDDGSFNQGAWDGIQQFVAANPGTVYDFLQPHEASDEARIDMIEDAVNRGANVLVLPGFDFIASVSEAQYMFSDVKFVLLDASPATFTPNTAAIHYAEEQAGFLAGYAAVMDGHRNLGFMGGIAVPAVVRFGHGFIQGAEHAAESLGLDAGEVVISYQYLGGFAPDPAHATTASAWFAAGTEVIFAAAGGAGFSVKSGAEGSGGLVIGVDVDQHAASPTVVTSAMKALDVSVYDMLIDFAAGSFRGGNELMFNAAVNGVGLPMNNSRFDSFSQAQYDAIFAELASGRVSVNGSLSMDDIVVSLVTVNQM